MMMAMTARVDSDQITVKYYLYVCTCRVNLITNMFLM